jgi:hypothetical protein
MIEYLTSIFIIQHSTCPQCPGVDSPMYFSDDSGAAISIATHKAMHGRRVFDILIFLEKKSTNFRIKSQN